MAKQEKDKRPPIVTILGHVDHGKTTLLDKIRSTRVAQKEAGGITQTIGASVVETKNGEKITFIDTPGHAAFAKMRARGAKLADIAILVVAADDSVKPQTEEALEYILAEELPFIVAATKTDLQTANVARVKSDLEKKGVLFENSGGDTPLVEVSGRTGKGIDDLLEVIILVAQLNEITGSSTDNLDAVVIETGKDKRGSLVSLVLRKGELNVGDYLVTQSVEAKVRGLFDWSEKPIKHVSPGEPILVLGFNELPEVGSQVWKKDEKTIEISKKESKPLATEVQEDEIAIVLKADNAGSLEAINSNLPKKVVVIHSGVGDVNETDVFMAKPGEASIIAFSVNVPKNVSRLADTEGLKIKSYDIIYKLFEDLDDELKKDEKKILGRAKIVATFPYNNKQVAGCKVTEGVIGKSQPARITRNGKEIGVVKIISLKREKQDIDVAKQGEECGILFTPQLDFEVGDVILSGSK